MKKRLRWWHRKKAWIGQAGWEYHWGGKSWIGNHPTIPGEQLELAPGDTAKYGPYQQNRMRFPNGIPVVTDGDL